MANYFSDNDDLQSHFLEIDLQDIVDLMENGYVDADDTGLASYEDAIDTFRESLDLLGDISANFIAPRSAAIDEEGSELVDGKVIYSKPTEEARQKLAESGFMGVMLPRRYGGAGFPSSIYMMMIEMVSRADASLMTLFGYQDVGELIARFGTEEQGEEFLPGLASGDSIGAIVLSEPGAGSDLQAIKLRATEDESGQWHLNGVKHFISNGCGDVLMVLARSEEKIANIFGLSLFVCPKSEQVKVARVEEKMGLHGSPTCELQFEHAPAQLVGRRKAGLTRYVLENLSQARFSVAAQALGIAEGAYQQAAEYAQERVQFGQKIGEFPAIQELLTKMLLSLQSSRAMLYEAIHWFDIRVQLMEAIAHDRVDEDFLDDARARLKVASNYNNLLSPLVKYVITEACQQVCIDAQQIFGGMGYMVETGIERRVRDIRITTIYEGASQVQIASSLKHVMADCLMDLFDDWADDKYATQLHDIVAQIEENRQIFHEFLEIVQGQGNTSLASAVARDLADMYSQVFGAYALLRHVRDDAEREQNVRQYVVDAHAFATAKLVALKKGKYDRWLE